MSQRQAKRARQVHRVQSPKSRQSSKPEQASRSTLVRVGLAVGALALIGAIVGGVVLSRGRGPATAVAVSTNGPLKLSGTNPITGQPVDIASYVGKPVVVNVWASWCPGCNQEAADLARFAAQHRNVQVVGVDTQDTTGGAKGFYRRWNWHHPSIADPSGRLAASLAGQGLPTTYFLDAQHRIVSRIVGAGNLASFDQGLQQALHPTTN